MFHLGPTYIPTHSLTLLGGRVSAELASLSQHHSPSAFSDLYDVVTLTAFSDPDFPPTHDDKCSITGQSCGSIAAVLNLWVATLWGVSNDLFTGFTYQTSCILDIYIASHNSSKITN